MSKRTLRFMVLFIILVLALSSLSGVSAQQKTTVTWFVGLGTGTNPEQIETQEQVVAAFNEAHPDIELVLNIAPSYEAARDLLTTLMASNQTPDIIGPVGFDG